VAWPSPAKILDAAQPEDFRYRQTRAPPCRSTAFAHDRSVIMMIAKPTCIDSDDQARVAVCGVWIDALTMAHVVDRVQDAITHGRSLAISVVNVAKLVNLRTDALLRESVVSGDLVLADGAPVVWLSRLKRTPLPERVAGIDLMFELFALADRQHLRVFLLGAKPEVLQTVKRLAEERYRGLTIAGTHDGYFDESDERRVAETIRDSHAHILFVAMTSPKKEAFMKRWMLTMNVPVTHGVGGSFDVMAGVTRRAPKWMQRCGLEWLYRVLQEPRRMWKRYLVTNTVFMMMAVKDLFSRHKSAGT